MNIAQQRFFAAFNDPIRRRILAFHAPHGEPLASFHPARDDIRACLIPAVREHLGL